VVVLKYWFGDSLLKFATLKMVPTPSLRTPGLVKLMLTSERKVLFSYPKENHYWRSQIWLNTLILISKPQNCCCFYVRKFVIHVDRRPEMQFRWLRFALTEARPGERLVLGHQQVEPHWANLKFYYIRIVFLVDKNSSNFHF